PVAPPDSDDVRPRPLAAHFPRRRCPGDPVSTAARTALTALATAAMLSFGAGDAQAAPDLARQVRTTTAERGAITTSRTASVTIEPARDAQVAAGVSGQVRQVLVREGGAVEQGDAVILIDDTNLRLQVDNAAIALSSARINLAAAERAGGEGVGQAQAALRAAEANLQLIERQYAEAQQLYELGAVAANELSGLEAQLAQARSAAQQARDAVARSQRLDGEDLELMRLQVRQAENQLAQAEKALADASVR